MVKIILKNDKTAKASNIIIGKIEKDKTAFNFGINNELRECNKFRLEHLHTKEKESLKKVVFEYKDIQYKEAENVTFTITIKHSSQTKHDLNIQIFDEEVNIQINEMIKQGIIRKSKSKENRCFRQEKVQNINRLQKFKQHNN